MVILRLILFAAIPVCQATGRFGGFPDCEKPPLSQNKVCDANLPPNERAKSLISAFTLSEKIANLINTAPGVPRLGLPEYEWWNEALHGIAISPGSNFTYVEGEDWSYATSFPMPVNIGAAFDDEGVQEMGRRVSLEARGWNNAGRGGLDFWTPNVNPYRDPRWGRGTEVPGEDAFHISRYIHALLSGMHFTSQNNNTVKPIVATCKHFAAYDLEGLSTEPGVTNRFNFDAKVSLQELSEYYLLPFKACVDADVGAMMCAYNSVNGVPGCANEYLLQKVLREHWGWGKKEDKWVVSDCQAVQMVREGHNYVKTKEEAAARSLNAGTDLECGTYFDARFAYYDTLPQALNQSLTTVAAIDRALVRLYSSLISLGYFDPLSQQSEESRQLRSIGWKDVEKTEDGLAYRLAVESVVLVKNDGVLPLDGKKKIALVGPLANATTQMQGNYAGVAPHIISILDASKTRNLSVAYAKGSEISSYTNSSINAALSAAKDADVILFAGGIDGTIEFESKDRPNITWPSAQTHLLTELLKLRKPTVVVQMGGPVDSTALLQGNGSANAFLWAGYPGQEGGRAILDIILGVQAPSGRMPVTVYPGSYVDDVAITDMTLRPAESNKGLGRTHMWYTGKPVIPFGHGLSYSKWEYGLRYQGGNNWTVSVQTLLRELRDHERKDVPLTTPVISFEGVVKNTGTVKSSHVVLAFLHAEAGPKPYPKQMLVGYKRFNELGGGQEVKFELGVELGSLARTDESGTKVFFPGTYEVWLGNEPGEGQKTRFVLTGQPEVLEKFPQP